MEEIMTAKRKNRQKKKHILTAEAERRGGIITAKREERKNKNTA